MMDHLYSSSISYRKDLAISQSAQSLANHRQHTSHELRLLENSAKPFGPELRKIAAYIAQRRCSSYRSSAAVTILLGKPHFFTCTCKSLAAKTFQNGKSSGTKQHFFPCPNVPTTNSGRTVSLSIASYFCMIEPN